MSPVPLLEGLLCDYTAGHSDRDCVFPTTSSLKSGARLEGVDANIVAVIFDPALLYKVSACCGMNSTACVAPKMVKVKGRCSVPSYENYMKNPILQTCPKPTSE